MGTELYALPSRVSFSWAASGRLAVLHLVYEFAWANYALKRVEADGRAATAAPFPGSGRRGHSSTLFV